MQFSSVFISWEARQPDPGAPKEDGWEHILSPGTVLGQLIFSMFLPQRSSKGKKTRLQFLAEVENND